MMGLIAADIQRSDRSISAVKLPGASNTPQDFFGAIKGKVGHGGKSMLDMMGVLLGEHHGGPVGAIAGGVATHLVQSLHGVGVARIDELVTQATLNPKLAVELLKKAPAKVTPISLRPIAAALVKASIPASAMAQDR